MKKRFAALATAALTVVGPVSAALAAPPHGTNYQATSVSLRDDQANDVLLSDGNPVYSGKEVSSTRITDFTDGRADRFQFQPWGQRRVRIHSSHINNGVPVTCDWTYIVFTTTNPATLDWFEILSAGSQPNVSSDASFICHDDMQHRFRVSYPDHPGECALIEQLDPTTWRFSAPGYSAETAMGCPATLRTSVKEKGQETVTEVTGVSAPFEITAVIP